MGPLKENLVADMTDNARQGKARQGKAEAFDVDAYLSQTFSSVVSDLIVEQREKDQSTIQPQSLKEKTG